MSRQLQVPQSADSDPRSVLERRYPHIVQGLIAVWNHQEAADSYFDMLLMDDRANRQGLPTEIFEDLLLLSEVSWKRRHFNEHGRQVSADSFRFMAK
jgi:hypothetical protein